MRQAEGAWHERTDGRSKEEGVAVSLCDRRRGRGMNGRTDGKAGRGAWPSAYATGEGGVA